MNKSCVHIFLCGRGRGVVEEREGGPCLGYYHLYRYLFPLSDDIKREGGESPVAEF